MPTSARCRFAMSGIGDADCVRMAAAPECGQGKADAHSRLSPVSALNPVGDNCVRPHLALLHLFTGRRIAYAVSVILIDPQTRLSVHRFLCDFIMIFICIFIS